MNTGQASTISTAADARRTNTLDEKSKLRLQRAVKDFEAIFVGYLLKSMRSSIPKSDMFGESFGGDMLESMFDMELAKHLSRNSNLGLAELLYRQMTGESSPASTRKTPEQRLTECTASGKPVADERRIKEPHEGVPLQERLRLYEPIIEEAARQKNLDAKLIKAVMVAESAGVASARSPKNAKGLMQLLDSTATELGVRNVWDPRENIFGGAKYLRQLVDRFQGDLERAVASYNAGPGAVEKYKGVPPYKETREYVGRVMKYLQYFQQQEFFHENQR